MKSYFSFLIVQILFLQLSAQNIPDVQVSRLSILIGEPFDVELIADSSIGAPRPSWLLSDSSKHFEFLSVDSSKPYHCIIRLTSWDTGFWKPEPVTAFFFTRDRKSELKVSIPSIRVGYARYADNNLNDIKPIIQSEPQSSSWPLYLLFGLSAITLLFLTFRYFNTKRKQPNIIATQRTVRTSSEIRQLLQQYDEATWTSRPAQKKAFIEIRTYILQLQPIQQQRAFESQPFQVWISRQQSWLRKENLEALSAAAEITDLVIYAKYFAEPAECKQVIRAFNHYLDDWDKKDLNKS